MSQTQINVEDVNLDALEVMPADEMVRYAIETFGTRCAIGTSGQKTGVVIIDFAAKVGAAFRVFFIDTLLNPQETYDLLDELQRVFGVTVERFAPEEKDIKWLGEAFGQWPHFVARESCCRIRKGRPNEKALATLDVWISGLRADQSEHRKENARKATLIDAPGPPGPGPTHRKILKLNPMLDWSEQDVDRYTTEHQLPYNKLYDYVSPLGERYKVIGCTACHIPVKDTFDKRLGKFPWEHGKKECGLHKDGGGI